MAKIRFLRDLHWVAFRHHPQRGGELGKSFVMYLRDKLRAGLGFRFVLGSECSMMVDVAMVVQQVQQELKERRSGNMALSRLVFETRGGLMTRCHNREFSLAEFNGAGQGRVKILVKCISVSTMGSLRQAVSQKLRCDSRYQRRPER